MYETYGMALLLVREVFGVPLDLVLAIGAVATMLGLMLWGSRPSVIARYAKRPEDADGEGTAPGPDEPEGDR